MQVMCTGLKMVSEPSILQVKQLLTLVSVFTASRTQTAVITPLSYTARLGSVGTFHCATTGHHVISWHVNGVPSSYPEIQNRQIITTDETAINATWSQSSLTVYASQENDGLSIYCIAVVLGGPDGFSATATFYVQRHFPQPVNLTLDVSSNRRELILRWNCPSEMIVIVYTVYVNITRTGTELYFNTTMREYTLENPCSDVQFKVTAWDDSGKGNSSTVLYRHYSNETNPDMIVAKTITSYVTFTTSGEPSAQLTFQVHGSCLLRRLQLEGDPLHFLVEMWSDCSGSRHHQGPLTLESTIVNSTVALVIPHLFPKCHVTARVQNQEVFNSSSNITFATYGVQGAEISTETLTNSICITCVLAQGTSSQGCYVSLLENHDSVVTNITGVRIEREGGSLNATGCVENLEGGLYHVVVYDIEADGTVDWHNSALLLTAALNWTFTSDQSNTSRKEPSPTVDEKAPSMQSINVTLQEDNVVSVIAGSAVGGALLLVVTIGVLLCTLIMKLKRHSAADKSQNMEQSKCDDDTDEIEMKSNNIYGQLPQQQVVRNPAYNWWKPTSL